MANPIDPTEHVGKRVYWKSICHSMTINSGVVSDPPVHTDAPHLLHYSEPLTRWNPGDEWTENRGNAEVLSRDFYLNAEDVPLGR